MATVYITQELISRVKQKISSMARAERSSDLPKIDMNFPVDASHLFNVGCWGASHVHLVNQIPKDWLAKQESASISVRGTLDDGRTLLAGVRFTGLSSAYARPKDSYYAKTDSELSLEYVRALPEGTVGRLELLERWDDAVVELSIKDKWTKVESDVVDFLKKCKSLNEAVKLFAGVRMYLHYEDIERLDRKVERASQRKAIVESVDTDGLTAAAIAAKLAEAS